MGNLHWLKYLSMYEVWKSHFSISLTRWFPGTSANTALKSFGPITARIRARALVMPSVI
jgi:hypothetical protein